MLADRRPGPYHSRNDIKPKTSHLSTRIRQVAPSMKRAFSVALIIAIFGVLIIAPNPGAQAQQISPEQMRQWQALPEAQKQQLLKQLGVSQAQRRRLLRPDEPRRWEGQHQQQPGSLPVSP